MKKLISVCRPFLFAAMMALLLTPLFGVQAAAGFGIVLAVGSFFPMPQGVLSLNNTNNISARDTFLRAKKIFCDAWLPSFNGNLIDTQNYVDSLKLSQHEIRLEVELTTGNTNFKFALTPNQNNTGNDQFATENRLQLQDSLVASEYGIYIAQAANNNNDTTFQLCTYPNLARFAAADAAALNSTFYSNGAFRMTCNNDVIMPYRGLFNHWYKPQTQQTAALGAGSPDDQIRGSEDGMITLEPNVLLIGSKGYIPEIVLPAALGSVTAQERAILIFRGVLAQNSTPVS